MLPTKSDNILFSCLVFINEFFFIVEDEDYLKVSEQLQMNLRFAPKKLTHVRFKNLSMSQARDTLKNLPDGEVKFHQTFPYLV